jgi:DNA-binding LytR/AlgR family response regulator
MIKTIIVDDEPLALDVLETYINQLPQVELVARCENAVEANEVLRQHDVDLILLDIQMPQITGLQFIKSLARPPAFIFTTAYPDYAVDGFELNATDYLVKPISLDRFMQAINKVEANLVREHGNDNSGDDQEDFMFVKADKKLVKVNFEDVLYIEGLKDYVIIRLEGSRVITLQTMKSLEQRLPERYFRRVHRSYIINIQRIEALQGNTVEIMEKGRIKTIPIGKNYRDEILEIVNENRL